jgi:hypothetical protein
MSLQTEREKILDLLSQADNIDDTELEPVRQQLEKALAGDQLPENLNELVTWKGFEL